MAHTFNYSVIPGNNNSTPPDGMPEGQAPSTVNDAWRQGKSYERASWADANGEDGGANNLVSGGSANAYTLSIQQRFSAYHPGMYFTFQANHTNTGGVTLAVTTPLATLTAKPIVSSTGNALGADAIVTGQWLIVTYDASNDRFVMLTMPTGVAIQQIQNSEFVYLTNVLNANAVTATASPTLTAYVEGQRFHFLVAATNTAAVTLDIDSLGAQAVKTNTGDDLQGGEWIAGQTMELIYTGSQFRMTQPIVSAAVTVPRGYISGVVPSNAADLAHDLTFSPGEARSEDNTESWVLPANLTKRGDAVFAEGDNQGGLGQGVTLPTSGTIHCHAISKNTNGASDIYYDTSLTGANAPTGWTFRRRVFSHRTDGSANLYRVQVTEKAGGALETEFFTPLLDSDQPSSAAATTHTLSVPTGLAVTGLINVYAGVTTASYISPFYVQDQGPTTVVSPLATVGTVAGEALYAGRLPVRTDTTGKIRSRELGGGAVVRIATLGWIDERNIS